MVGEKQGESGQTETEMNAETQKEDEKKGQTAEESS